MNGTIERQQKPVTAASSALEAERSLSDSDQTLADSDQTLSDADQMSSDRDQTSADCDQVAADRDQAASDRDVASGGDTETHDVTQGIRSRSTRQREQTAQWRLDAAEQRDQVATSRDLAALTRDQAADARDRAMAQREVTDDRDARESTVTSADAMSRSAGRLKRRAALCAKRGVPRAGRPGSPSGSARPPTRSPGPQAHRHRLPRAGRSRQPPAPPQDTA